MTLGVVTFNSEQQRLIEDLLDEERRKAPSIERYFSEDALEPVFVKNLESVQGDERDIIYFSTTFGPDRTGTVSMNFGPMNRDGGERRLNVAVTRARDELRVFASLKPEQIDLSRTKAEGVRDLKHFLEFAERGPKALAEAVFGTVGDFDSLFEQAVAERLGSKGWQVHPQVGVSSFRIDLGVVDPDAPGSYLAGVECDGATYHRSATARDRDKLREQVLRGLGWEILRIWSTDWWHDANGSLEKVHSRLEALLEKARAKRAEEAERQAMLAQQHADAESSSDEESINDDVDVGESQDDLFNVTYARNESGGGNGHLYKVSDPLDAVSTPDPDSFFVASYNQTLASMITHVVEIEGPIREDLLAKRIARAHGWTRTGARIRDRVLKVAKKAFVVTEEDAGLFVWPSFSSGESWDEFRRPDSGEARAVDEISMPELVALAMEVTNNGLTGTDAVTTMARETGLKKLRANTRERLEHALELAVTMVS